MSQVYIDDDPLMQPPGKPATLPGLAAWQVARIRQMQRWAILNALRENGQAMAECIEASPSGPRRRQRSRAWRD